MSNRIIKFRAWDRVNQVLTGGFTLTDCSDGYVDSESIKLNECDVMQFTGLFDENGTEIYEGDIVALIGGGVFPIVFNERWAQFGIITSEIGFDDLGRAEHFTDDNKLNYRNVKVVGNIHESLQLIK